MENTDTNAPPAKRQKTLPSNANYVADLPNLSNPIVRVDVGSLNERVTFQVHKAVLCKTSGFLKAALTPEWQGPEPRPIDLTDEDPTVFKMYLQWLYTGKVSTQPFKYADNGEEMTYCNTMARAFVLGAKLVDAVFQTAVLRGFCECMECEGQCPSHEATRTIYNGSPSGSPARKLMVDIWAWNATKTWQDCDNVVDSMGAEFANDLIRAFIAERHNTYDDMPWIEEPEQYDVKTSECSTTSDIWQSGHHGR